ncbi:DUF2505 domain-containing protein [Actinomyces faecalis]|uniref:DUF2505 domain-containing protein n=1 Tax=Actinomyces faecalis TaxID=2722820 RepID=UPI0015579E3B|nr:DUF2505 domain-containing protein [Actinomyces faecalis]
MKKTVTVTYPAEPQRVTQMLADPRYLRGRLSRVDLEDAEVEVTERGRGFVSTVRGQVPSSRLPQAAARFVRSAVGFALSESWGEPADDGARDGSMEVTVSGAPVRLGARLRLRPATTQVTTLTMDLDLGVNVPLLGRSLEDKAMSMVDAVVTDEERRAAAWLADH